MATGCIRAPRPARVPPPPGRARRSTLSDRWPRSHGRSARRPPHRLQRLRPRPKVAAPPCFRVIAYPSRANHHSRSRRCRLVGVCRSGRWPAATAFRTNDFHGCRTSGIRFCAVAAAAGRPRGVMCSVEHVLPFHRLAFVLACILGNGFLRAGWATLVHQNSSAERPPTARCSMPPECFSRRCPPCTCRVRSGSTGRSWRAGSTRVLRPCAGRRADVRRSRGCAAVCRPGAGSRTHGP